MHHKVELIEIVGSEIAEGFFCGERGMTERCTELHCRRYLEMECTLWWR